MLRGYVLRGSKTIHAARYMRRVLHGIISLERSGGFGLPAEVEKTFRILVDAIVLNLKSRTRHGKPARR